MPRWGMRPTRDDNSWQHPGGMALATVRKDSGGIGKKAHCVAGSIGIFLFWPTQCVNECFALMEVNMHEQKHFREISVTTRVTRITYPAFVVYRQFFDCCLLAA